MNTPTLNKLALPTNSFALKKCTRCQEHMSTKKIAQQQTP